MGLFSRTPKNEADGVILKVFEAYTADVGKGIARIDKDSMKILNLSEGDVIEVQGKRNTPAKCRLLYHDDSSRGAIRIDGLTRNNSFAEIGEKIIIRKVPSKKAEKIKVIPLEAIPPVDESYISDSLNDVAINKGDNLMVPYFGGRLAFQVIQTDPEDTSVIVSKNTVFQIEEYVPDESSEEVTKDNRFLDIIKERYAKGEITKEEFEQMKKDLSD